MSTNIAVKPPTSTDLKILDYLKSGKSVNNIDALNLFRTTGLRDSIYRLRKAGFEIESETIYYQTSDGRTKHYVNYSVKSKVS